MSKEKIIYPDTVNADLTAQRYKEIKGKTSKKEKDALYLLSSHSRFIGRAAISDTGLVDSVLSSNFLKNRKELADYNSELEVIINGSSG